MARTGMSNLIEQVRAFCNIGTNDYTLGTATYWTDDQVQIVLDRHKITVSEEELRMIENTVSGGSTEYKVFHSAFGNFEQTTGGTAIFYIEDSVGTIIGSADYSVDYANGIVTFDTTQAGSSRYLTGYSYDIYGAASDIWNTKAGHFVEVVSFKTDNMSVNRSDKIKNARKVANDYAMQARTKTIEQIRNDCV